MFDIRFLSSEPELQEEGWYGLWGATTLGDYTERFLAPVDAEWPRAYYERQWLEAARRLVAGADRTGFFTQVGFMWWVMYREGSRVFVQEMLVDDTLFPAPFIGPPLYDRIPDRISQIEDGTPVSEWQLELEDIRAFVERLDGAAVPA